MKLPSRLVPVLLVLETLAAPLGARSICCCPEECSEGAPERSKGASHACCPGDAAPAGHGLGRGACRDECAARPTPAVSEGPPIPRLDRESPVPVELAAGVSRREAGALELASRGGGAHPPERPPLYLLTMALRI